MSETINDSSIVLTRLNKHGDVEVIIPDKLTKFQSLLEIPHYEFEPFLPVVREKIKAWRRENAKVRESKKL